MSLHNLFDLSNKVAIVTGGANGIGKASALLLAEAGADVVIGDLNLEQAEEVAKEIRAMGRKAIAVSCNILDDAEMVKAVETTVEQLGGIHILVNVAGGGGGGREVPEKITVTEIERDFKLNVYSVWRMIQLCAPHMKKAGYGTVINIASMGAITHSPGMSGYSSSKAAVVHMGANLAFDYPYLRINAIGPGATRTNALATVLTPEIEKVMLAHTPIKRLGEPEDIAGAVLYFASPISSWVNGQVLYVNGGGVQTLA
ncbi:7-alpha-hydroxysteroid dehydrogenase [Mergibacter septicus]|uniref:glucose 1-dehydrogenase n=1 Tax=Mergibacter septicus TaxID=221402 RepID=UPI0011790422|nr:glucose 1-dehydrogenase [Mergibacter septicus]AWX13259.1 7-alpha-hydroxysteroid dehydrogenase [Mergibacter septicus]